MICELCGHVLLFEADRFHDDDERTFYTGPTEQEDHWEREEADGKA